ncbi:hypothetical protein SAY87_017548 [Trapa incisa]|uniref:Uncharacterized protein n=1 Tax=Trapa incisa TaxID=236973 RepID=A0AAN7QU78_9MYRT|nr:hypothetical protein SAY87_017548 [Trapa incisa]
MAVCLSTASSSSDCDSSSSVLDDVMDGQCLRLWILKEPIFLMTTIYPCYSSMSLIKKGEGGVFYFVLRLTGMQRVKGGSSLLSFLSAPLIKKKALNTLGAVQDTYFSTKDTFERHRVVFTLGTSIASVATAWAGYSLRHYHETNFDRRLESIEKAMKNNYHFEHADIKKIVDQESSRSAVCFATSATTLIIGFVACGFSPLLKSVYQSSYPSICT